MKWTQVTTGEVLYSPLSLSRVKFWRNFRKGRGRLGEGLVFKILKIRLGGSMKAYEGLGGSFFTYRP
jgi:hypothetical protein